MKFLSLAACLLLLWASAILVRGDEGMWLYTAPPHEQIKARYRFELTESWLDHLMKASVRFNSGGSGSFVSSDGLVITNHHVGADSLQKMGSKEHDYLRDGFYARTAAEEIRCHDLELNVLQSIEDVTARVNAGIPAGATGAKAAQARRKIMAEIEKESREKTGLRSDVVTLYQGGAYHLYRARRYTDIRLVFAPEAQIAFFGGDPDNFEYPRYNLDVCFFRVYENGQPLKTGHFLKWSERGAQDNDLVFVSGHPGRTSRLLTVPELEYLRDISFPYTLQLLKRREVLLAAWSARSGENARRAKEELFGYKNSRKVREGSLAALQDPGFLQTKAAAEAAFRQQLAGRAGSAEALAAYKKIARAQAVTSRQVTRYRLLETGHGFMCDSFSLARELLRAGDEQPKPNGARLREYTDARRESLELGLFSDKPIHSDLEVLSLGDSLTFLTEQLGYNDRTVQAVLAGQSPRARAASVLAGTRVREVAFRKKLYEGGSAAVAGARDPLIELARLVDDEARELRKILEAQDEIKQQAQAAIARARFGLEGASRYPDATFTLRLSYGTVKGYVENGVNVPSATVLSGLYARNAEQQNNPPFDLPSRWIERKTALDPATPINFVSTCDIIGGNSGSPVVNRANEFVGIIFDGNIHSLSSDFNYDDRLSRAISVHSAGILEALRKVYQVEALANELVQGRR